VLNIKETAVRLTHRAKVCALGDVLSDILVLFRQGHDQEDGVSRVVADDSVAVQKFDQDREYQKPRRRVAVVLRRRRRRRRLDAFDVGVVLDVEEYLEQVAVVLLHKS